MTAEAKHLQVVAIFRIMLHAFQRCVTDRSISTPTSKSQWKAEAVCVGISC